MDIDVKREARKQYLKYFGIWFVIIAVLAVITVVVAVGNAINRSKDRNNAQAPTERVYDMANKLSEEEEDKLRALIAEAEEKIKADIVLVTYNQVMEGTGAPSAGSWETNMMNTADDFYDQNQFGYDKACGDGVLILDNWLEGQAGTWLSTCGRLVDEFAMSETDRVLDEIYYGIDDGAYEAYRRGIEEIVDIARAEKAFDFTYLLGAFVIATVSAGIFIACKLQNKEGSVTVTASTYVESGKTVMNVKQDRFIRKVVTRRKIPRQTSSGGGGRSGGGVHRSSGGVRHGGGGRRR